MCGFSTSGRDLCTAMSVCLQVVDLVQTLDGGRRNMYDPDEIEEEQREREKRNKINADFKQFTTRVQVRCCVQQNRQPEPSWSGCLRSWQVEHVHAAAHLAS